MIFDEPKFSNLLGQIDLTSIKIKRLAYHMVSFYENSESIVNLWKNCFHLTKTQEGRLALIFLAHETIEQTAKKKNDIFIIAFGDIFYEIFDALAKTITDIDSLKQLIQLLAYWEDKMYYSHNFISRLKQMLTEKEAELNNEPIAQLKTTNDKLMLDMIMSNPSSRINLELSIEEKNIKEIYDKIDFDKVNAILSSMEPPNQATQNYINDFDKKIREVKRILVEDLCKREHYTLHVTEMLNKEKEMYFTLEENKNKPSV